MYGSPRYQNMWRIYPSYLKMTVTALNHASWRCLGIKQPSNSVLLCVQCKVDVLSRVKISCINIVNQWNQQLNVSYPLGKKGDCVSLYYVGCHEDNHENRLSWHFLTSEPATNKHDAERKTLANWRISQSMGKRRHSSRRLTYAKQRQSRKMIVILAFIAALLLILNKKRPRSTVVKLF